MKLIVDQIYDATVALSNIANRNSLAIPQMAKFKLAKMHDTLEPIFMEIEKERVALVQKFGSEKFADPEKKVTIAWNVDKTDAGFQDYIDGWSAISKREMEVNVKPITLQALGNDPKGLEFTDFKMLSCLVVDAEEKE